MYTSNVEHGDNSRLLLLGVYEYLYQSFVPPQTATFETYNAANSHLKNVESLKRAGVESHNLQPPRSPEEVFPRQH